MSCEIDLLSKLVAIDTTSTERKGYEKIANLLVKEAQSLGLKAEKIVDAKGIPQILITIPNAPKKAKKVVFITHYDVVPVGEGWDFNPFKPFVKDSKLYGRGAADNKSNIAAAIIAFSEAVKEKLPLKIHPVLAVAGGEETGESEEFFKAIKGDLAIVLDVGCESISIGASGSARLTVKVKGKQAHSAYPYKGVNAIYEAAKIIEFIKQKGKEFEKTVLSKFPAPTNYERLPRRMNVTMISSGIAANIIPGECTLTIDIRTIPEEKAEKVAEETKRMLESFAKENSIDIEVQIKSSSNGWYTTNQEAVDKVKEIAEEAAGKPLKISAELGGTDGRYLIERMPVIQYGTLREDTNFHGKNEFVHLADVKTVKAFVKKLLTAQL
ncbi:MAG: ArgE/DapE family deacylase [Candidatus Bathyarchaeota archaeon]|jgi:succinyl-diaminopimelate desuccinylase|nr:ArgE/DapE family deacylase [Candidatus Bathyarchaeota archaeon A05DMB-3]MDH7606351.1 ArgE/DapE family deacylase [Candidatus Bathyarchaeota archaeon]